MKIMRKFLAQVVLAALLITGIVPNTVMTARAEETAFFVVPEEKEAIASVSELTPSEAVEEDSTEGEELSDEETGAELSLTGAMTETLSQAGETLSGTSVATPSRALAMEKLTDYFESVGCKNTSDGDVSSFWNMLALASLGKATNTETDYSTVDYKNLGTQVLSKYIIAMINDGVNPASYEAVTGTNVVDYLAGCMHADGGFYNETAGETEAAYYVQPFAILALWMAGKTVDQKAADWFSDAGQQDTNGILGAVWSYEDIDTTCWAMTYCNLAGISYPNKSTAEAYIKSVVYGMDNSNTYACWLEYLVNAGKATAADEEHILAHYFGLMQNTEENWLYGFCWMEGTGERTFNLYSTQQGAVAFAQSARSKSVYTEMKANASVVKPAGAQPGAKEPTEASGKTADVTVRLSDVLGTNNTVDFLSRMELTVNHHSGNVFTGISQTTDKVTLYDVFAEAVYASLYGEDPTYAQVMEAATEINEKMAFSSLGWNTKYFSYTDGNCMYYLNRTTAPLSPAQAVTDGDDVFMFHYDWAVASYAYFDETSYSATTEDAAKVHVRKELWVDPYYTGIPAVVVVSGSDGDHRFLCDADGKAVLSGLKAGYYELTAEYGTSDSYIVQPYADLLVTEYIPKPTPAPASDDSGSSTTVYGTPVKTGTWNDPVIDGTWKQNADGSWTYTTNALFRSTWGYILNPYAKGTEKNQWFYFDANGKMLTGWQVIGGRWYYMNTAADGSQGACLLNTATPDGYTVNENGEWTVNGVVQTAGAAASAAQANGIQASASGTASKAETSAGSSSGSGEEKPKTYSFSVSISANVKTDEGKQVSFSGSKTIKAEEDETYTAYDALESLCTDKGYAIEGSSSYVSAINGLGEFDAGPTSGWMYSVNGKYPNVPAGDYEVKKGDKIRWVYVTKYTEVTDNF